MLDLLVAALQWSCAVMLALGIWFVAFSSLTRDPRRKGQPVPLRVPQRLTSE